jgi:hypothetical protein
MGSSDPVLKLLKDFSYNVVRLPRTGLEPLQVLKKSGNDLEKIGDITDLFVSGNAPLPEISPDRLAPFINGRRTRNLNLNVGLSILGGIIGALGGSKLGASVGFNRASTLVFEFNDVKMNEVDQLKLSRYLTAARVDPAAGPFAVDLEDDKLYVITNTIKSRKFTTEVQAASGANLSVDVPVIQEAVGGSVSVKREGTDQSKVTFEGDTPVVFGFQAVRMLFERGAFKGFKTVKADEAGMRAMRPSTASRKPEFEMLKTRGSFTNLVEE